MAAYAYQNPLPDRWKAEFDMLDLAHTRQLTIPCDRQCGVKYSLIFPEGAGEELLSRYGREVLANMGRCGEHVGRMFFNF
jgi:hypothetical protein